jgi:hypothetical protein
MTIPSLEEVKRDGGFCFKFVSNDGKINKGMWIKFDENQKTPLKKKWNNKIVAGEIFFTKFDRENEKKSALWHEFGHIKKDFLHGLVCLGIIILLGGIILFTKLVGLMLLYLLLLFKQIAFYPKEFSADKYSARKTSSDDCLSMLNVVKEIYNNLDLKAKKKYLATHPSIEKRIAKIEKLNVHILTKSAAKK